MTGARTLVVVPAYDEADALPHTLTELVPSLDDAVVLVVDDGSHDDTASVARSHGVATLRLPFNLGVGAAVRAGLRYAVERGFSRVVVVDADGQHDPQEVKALLAALDEGADMAVGSRFASAGAPYEVSRLRRRAMGLLHWIVRLSTGHRFTDTTSGFRAFDRPVVELLARRYPIEYLADTVEVLIMVCKAGYRVVEVPTPMRPRAAGAPSTRRLRLVFNYLRLLVGILASASRPRRLTTTPPQGRSEP